MFFIDNLTINNINIISWELNGDGIDLCSVSRANITDSFIRTYDDCITLKVRDYGVWQTPTEYVNVKDCVVWSDYARAIVVGPEAGACIWGSGGLTDCIFEDCVVLEQPDGSTDYRAALSVVQQQQSIWGVTYDEYNGNINNILFKNILIDDIQFIAGKERIQEEFFHTFNTLYESGKQIILSSDKPPKDIQLLEDRLKSRFEWGIMADISNPDYETRLAILRKKAQLDNILIDDEILSTIATRIDSNIRELEGTLNKLIATASLTHSPICLLYTSDAADE